MEELRRKVDQLIVDVHKIDKEQAVIATSMSVLNQTVAAQTSTLTALAAVINKHQGAVGIIGAIWAITGGAVLYAVEHIKELFNK